MTPLEATLVEKGLSLTGDALLISKIREALARENLAWARGSQQVDLEILTEAAWRSKQAETGLDEVRARLTAHLEDHAHSRLRGNFVLEGTREVLDDRYNMIVSAAAEAMISDLPVAAKARVERVLRELDPDDIRWLDYLATVSWTRSPNVDEVQHAANERIHRQNVLARCPSSTELRAAMVVDSYRGNAGRVNIIGGVDVAVVTPRGCDVLRIMTEWIRNERAPFDARHGLRRVDPT